MAPRDTPYGTTPSLDTLSRVGLPNSLWAATARSPVAAPTLQEKLHVEACVVGAGFTGLSAALHMAERGVDVAVLDAEEPGWGASGRNGGQVVAGLKLDPDDLEACFGETIGSRVASWAGAAPDLVFDLVKRHRIDCAARRSGLIQAVHAQAALPRVESRCAQWTQRGAPVEVLDRAEVSRLLGSEAYVAGLLDRRGGSLQPLSYARGLADAAQRAGAKIFGNSRALELRQDGKSWRVSTVEGSVTASHVLLCTNGYTDHLWPGLEKSIIPVFSYQVATRPLSENLRRTILPEGHVCADTRRLISYFRLDPEGRLVVGARGKPKDSEDPSDYRAVKSELARLFPQVGDVEFDYFWAGKVALTADHLPHLHEPAPGLLAALGYNGRGVAAASAMGVVLSDRVAGVPAEQLPVPLSKLRPIPFHTLRGPALKALVALKGLRDSWETRN